MPQPKKLRLPSAVKKLAKRKDANNPVLEKYHYAVYFMLLRNRVLRYPLFGKYLMARFAIILALNMQSTIVSYFVYKLTYNPLTHKGDALVLGLMGLWEVIPAIGFSLFSGHFVDIREKKQLVFQCIVGYLLLTGFFIWLAWPGLQATFSRHVIIWLIYGGVFVGGALRAFLSPATFALMGLLIPKKLYADATPWSSAAWQAGFVVGPLLGGFMIVLTGYQGSQLCAGIIELIALGAVIFIPAQKIFKKDKEPILKSIGEGIKFVFSTQILLAALSLDMFAVLFGGAVALLPVYANEILKIGEVGFGWMRAAPGIGSILMLLFISAIPIQNKPGIKLAIAIAGFGVTTIIFGLCGNIASTTIFGTFFGCNISWAFILGFAMLLLGGMFDSVSVVIRSTILQLYTPDSMRGRVAAVNTMFISSSNELGAMESGMTARWWGTIPAVVAGGCMTLLVVGITYFISPTLRTVKLEPPKE